MKNKDIILICIALIIGSSRLYADPVITLFIRPYPYASEASAQPKLHKIHLPGKIAKYHMRRLHQETPIAGLFCTYAGFLARSNQIGQVTLPRKHDEPALSIIITNKIQPMLMAANTIHHWSIPIDGDAVQYSLERKRDVDTGLSYWYVKKQPVPDDRILPSKSLLIFAKPKNFYIPEGATLTVDSPNLVLPTIYARRSTDIATNAVHALAIRQFFDSVQTERKRTGKMYQMFEVY